MEQAAKQTARETPLATLHRSEGATLAEWFGYALPLHWTAPAAEQEFARNCVALVDKNYRAYFRFRGPDRARYLNAVLTNDIQGLAANRGNVSLLLNPQGHILAEIETYAMRDSLFCVSYAMIRERLAAWLEKYIIMDDVTLADESEQHGTLGLEGPKAAEVAREVAGLDLSRLEELQRVETSVCAIPCWATKRSPGGIAGCEFLTERERLAELWRVLSEAAKRHKGGAMGYAALSAQRLSQGVPWFGYDFGEKQIPHEAGLQDTHISYTKGCYTGQEIVERVRSRGQVSRQRVGLIFQGAEVPGAGETLTAERKQAGHVTRAARPSFFPRAIGMGYVRREHAVVGSELKWSGGAAVVAKFPEALETGASSRQR
jgi:folate-binding protein YgfZ